MTLMHQDHDTAPLLLHGLFASATHDASAAMCRWTDGLITVTLDEVRQIALEDVSAALDMGDELLTMVVLTIEGELGGNILLAFDDLSGRQLAALLLQRPVASDLEWSDLEKSALTETGNILGCAYVNALSRLIGTNLSPSPPYFIQDYGASVVQQAAMTQAATSDTLLLCEIDFRRQNEELDWRVVFIPTQGMQDALQRSLHATT